MIMMIHCIKDVEESLLYGSVVLALDIGGTILE